MIIKLVVFLIINFSALGIGAWLMGEGPASVWYNGLQKAPWTPPGWVFGAAWTLIMICFSFYMTIAHNAHSQAKNLLLLFAIQWILNVIWNPVFFNFHSINLGLVIIVLLTLLVAYIMWINFASLKLASLLIAPYLIWLLIATSLNAYVCLKN